MKCLFLDVASHEGLLACVTENAVVASLPIDHRVQDHELLPAIEQLQKAAGWTFLDLTHIACIVGPGGFTSLRVGVSVANALAHMLKIPSVAIHLSALFRARLNSADEASTVWLHSTKKQELFLRAPGADPMLIPVTDLPAHLSSASLWTGELIPEHRSLVASIGAQPASLRPLFEILPTFLARQPYKKSLLEPWYGREG